MNIDIYYKNKYLKYKNKYIRLKNTVGGTHVKDIKLENLQFSNFSIKLIDDNEYTKILILKNNNIEINIKIYEICDDKIFGHITHLIIHDFSKESLEQILIDLLQKNKITIFNR